jgi:hypothetical protein
MAKARVLEKSGAGEGHHSSSRKIFGETLWIDRTSVEGVVAIRDVHDSVQPASAAPRKKRGVCEKPRALSEVLIAESRAPTSSGCASTLMAFGRPVISSIGISNVKSNVLSEAPCFLAMIS